VCALRRATGFPLDDLTFVVGHFLPHLGRDNVYRILKAEGLSRRPAPTTPEEAAAKFKEYELGFVHVDVKHLPELRTADGELRERFLFVAIDRRSRSVHLAVKDEETEAAAKAFLEEALAAFPFRVTRLLTDRGSCFTADGFERRCRELGVEHRKTKPYTPRTNGMVERFDGRVQREVLGVTVASHRDLERLLAGFGQAYNARRQRVLDGRSPEEVVRERLTRDQGLANPGHRPPFDPCTLPRAMLVIGCAKDVSQPDSALMVQAKPSEVQPDQLAALRAHKAELLPILAAFGEAQVLIRPATPIPDEPKLGDRVWSRPLRPRRRKAA
jgi:transposase InsO family protein